MDEMTGRNRATPLLPRVPAKVGLANPKPALDRGDGNYS
jgi:hypothetical protein